MSRLWLLSVLAACADEPVPPPAPPAAPASTPEAPEASALAEPELDYRTVVIDDVGSDSVPPRPVELFIPIAPAPPRGFPFVVVTDGDLAATDFRTHEVTRRLSRAGVIDPMVVIAVPSRQDRNRELSVRAGLFVDYLADAVVPRAGAVVALADSGAILGYSFGGLTAVRAGLTRPDRFDRVIAMSPSLWFRRRAALRRAHDAPAIADRFWIDVGTREGNPREVVPYMVADARQLRDDLMRRGLSLGRDLGYYEAPGRMHAMAEAGARMEMALRFTFGPPCEPTSLALIPFDEALPVGRSASVAVTARCADGRPTTVPNGEVRFAVEGGAATIAHDGVWRARRPGRARLEARYEGLTADVGLQVRRAHASL